MVRFHGERQDTSAPGWHRLLELVDEAAADGREVFRPLECMSQEERKQVIELPPAIGRLTAVRKLLLGASNLVRIPPEIGTMTSLEELSTYTSRWLHWYPYELTRCPKLVSSSVSTRSLYGNWKYRPPFPPLQRGPAPVWDLDPGVWGTKAIRSCSVCNGPLNEAGPQQAWLSLRVATDVLPLLVNACSDKCLRTLPPGAEEHIRVPHMGGPDVSQPAEMYGH